MMRVCHLDTCPVGVATQNPQLRERFSGKPEFVETFFEYIAEEVRETLAALGLRSLDEAVGQVELLEASRAIAHWKAAGLDLEPILHPPSAGTARRSLREQDHGLADVLDQQLIEICEPAIARAEPVRATMPIRNVNRTTGTMLGSRVTASHGGAGLPADTIDITFTGSAGQSFGAFLPAGITLRLQGDANDYVGKGLSGGRIIVRPPREATFDAAEQIVAGNVIAYGATSGEMFLSGSVGERFAVRNSGSNLVVEGVGDHACEYMTGGRVVILGKTGRNLAAGMSGGVAHVLDLDPACVNREMVDLQPVTDVDALQRLVRVHAEETGSQIAMTLLARWPESVMRFTEIMPRDYARVLALQAQATATGEDPMVLVMGGTRG